MSTRFAVRSNRVPEQKEGNKIIFGTGEEVPFYHTCELFCMEIDKGKFEYYTGLESKHIKYSKYFNDEEKEILLKKQATDMKELNLVYGKTRLAPENEYFWKENSSFILNNETLVTFFDTKEPEHLLLYWKIVGGGYADEIGPSYEAAQSFGLPFYISEIVEEAERRTEGVAAKVKAFSLLEELSQKKSSEDMLWLSWMLHPSNMGYTKSTPPATLYNAHYEFIEGLLVKKAKKSCPKQFVDAYNLIKNDKPRAISEALVKAGEHFAIIYTDKDNKLAIRKSGLVLGRNIEEAIEMLLKPMNTNELESLREDVEEKLR